MIRIIFCALLLMCSIFTFAQRPPGGGMPIGTLSGKVIDSLSGAPLAYATVALRMSKNDSLVGGGISDEKGKLYIEDIRPGKYLVEVDYLGYEPKIVGNISIRPGGNEHADIGTIKLSEGAQQLDAVAVTAERSYMQVGIDRKVYTISKDISTEGADVISAMRNIPSIEVDIDGNLSLRGSGNVNVLIDGKPSVLSGQDLAGYLESLPASSVETVEVITNPSARFDPDGTAGLINIVLKKNRKKGISGGISAGIGTNNKYNGSANLNFRNRKFNLFANYGWRDQQSFGYRDVYRETASFDSLSTDSLSILNQRHDSQNLSTSHNIKLGLDYYLTAKTTVSFSGVYSNRYRGGGGLSSFEYLNQDLDPVSLSFQDETDRNESASWDANLRLEHQFSSRDHLFFADGRFSTGTRYDNEINYTRDANLDGSDGSATDLIRTLTENQDDQTIVLETGYIHPHIIAGGKRPEEKWRIETGLKAILRDKTIDFVSGITDTIASELINDLSSSNVFSLEENILSAYGTYRQRWGGFGAQLGLRAEAALTNPQLLSTGETFDNDYFSLFPTVHLAQQLNKNQELQVSYSRRLNRPQYWALNPFIDRSDPFAIRIGNPDLQPEFVHKVEAGYVRTWDKGHSFTASVYFTHTDNLITSFRSVDEEGITVTTYENFSWRRRTGVELIGNVNLTDWWRATLSTDLRNAQVDASNIEAGLLNSNFEYSGKVNTTMSLPWDLMLQMSGRYRGPRVGPQGTFIGYVVADASVRKDFLDKTLSVTLRVSDILDQRRFGSVTDIPGLFQEAEFKRESRIGWLTVNYRFGKQQFDKRRGRSGGGSYEDMGGEGM